MLFDTHIHLDLLTDLKHEVDAARKIGVNQFLVPGVRPAAWPDLLQTTATVAGVVAAPGVHPLAARDWNQTTRKQLLLCLQQTGTVAVGEIGLDSVIDIPQALQESVLRDQLRIAIDSKLPVVLHCRRATGRLIQILQQEGADRVGGIMHAFSGSLETAREAIKLGFALGIGAPITYPEAKRIPEVASRLPEEWIILETDAPDLAPHPHRGEANRPVWLQYVQHRLAELRGLTPAETAVITTNNARRVLRLPGGE